MKKRMIKLFAAVMSLTLVFSLAACSGTAGETTETSTTEPPVVSKPRSRSQAEKRLNTSTG